MLLQNEPEGPAFTNGASSSISSRAFTPDEAVNPRQPQQQPQQTTNADTIVSKHLSVASATGLPPPHRTHSLPEATLQRSTTAVPDGDLTEREKLLLARISQFEKQVAEVSLQQRIESRRTQLAQLPVS